MLQSPTNGATFNEGQGINLSWSATGNEYYGEVWGGPGGTLTFGWQTATTKDLGSQWAGYTYSWHVKARNGGGESGWSTTWTFSVEEPPVPTLLGDLDRDGDVDIFDYNLLVTSYGWSGFPGSIPADIDKNGQVDIFDYNILVQNYGMKRSSSSQSSARRNAVSSSVSVPNPPTNLSISSGENSVGTDCHCVSVLG